MSSGYRQIFTVLATLLLAITMPAQDIPVLPDDPSVLKGVMPDGMAYYLVSNPTDKGTADFALVQKTGYLFVPDSVSGRVREIAREALKELPRLRPSDTQSFLSRHGIAPGGSGYVKVTEDATVFRFEDVTVSGGKAVLDSVLLVLMDIADRVSWSQDEVLRNWYAPADQAIIVSGDINAKAVAEKLVNMSYMIPAKEQLPRTAHVWQEHEDMVFIADTSVLSPVADISMTWVSQRVPREYMNTVQPAMFEMAVNTLGKVAVRKIRKILEDKGIGVCDVYYEHVCSESSPYDDAFAVHAVVRSQDAERTLSSVTEVMASIDASGTGMDEYLLAEVMCLEEMEQEVSDAMKMNSDYVDRCMNSFLYNSSLASPKERLAFHRSRNLPDSMRLRLFNDIAMALLDSSANLTVRCNGDSLALRTVFDSVWRASVAKPGQHPSGMNMADTISFPGPSPKVRLKTSKKEHVSGGTIWTFSNGFKVIYKKMKSDRMYYTMAINGGYGGIKGLEAGEGAFISDYLDLCHIAGLKAGTFKDILRREGISMDMTVNLSNTMIGGYAPVDRMQLLLRSLLAVANERTRDDRAFGYYKECENLALELDEGSFKARMTAIDSIMCPDYRYSPYKSAGKMTAGFQDKVEGFLDDLSSRMNDGVLVLVGDMDEERLKKLLSEYAGGFRTQDVAFRRPVVRYQPVSGWSTYTVEGDRNCLDVVVSARMPVTAENYIAADLAASVLKRRLTEVLTDSGMHVDVTYNCRIYPEERLNVVISLSEISPEGFASGHVTDTPIEALAKVRPVLSELDVMEVSDDGLKYFKDRLKNMISIEMKDPAYWVDAIVLRYLDGKDLSTNYASKIDAVNASRVQSVLDMLDAGSKVEYVTSKKY